MEVCMEPRSTSPRGFTSEQRGRLRMWHRDGLSRRSCACSGPRAIAIGQRPPAVSDRVVPGHWEGDLIAGRDNSYFATFAERTTRLVVLVRVPSKETRTVIPALIWQIRRLSTHLKRSLTWGRGTELAHHRVFSVATGVQVSFRDPQSLRQRGSNENTNGCCASTSRRAWIPPPSRSGSPMR